METTTLAPKVSGEKLPNPLNIKDGETVIMDAEFDNPKEVIVENVYRGGYGAEVREIATGKKWSLTISCLSR